MLNKRGNKVTREQLQEFKAILEAEQAGTRRTLLQNRQDIGIENSADALEEISYTAGRELAMANLSRYSGVLRNVRAALGRIEDGAFGICLRCETMIGLKRLKAIPWTPLCIRCQEAADRNDVDVFEFVHKVGSSAA
jgi:DnaK suppressor protein